MSRATRRPTPSSVLLPHELLWPDAERGPWLVRAAFGRVGERIEVVGVELQSLGVPELVERFGEMREGPSGESLPLALTSELWRTLPLGRLLAQARTAWLEALDDTGLLERNPDAAQLWTGPRRRGRVDLERVAAIYLAAMRPGGSGKPLEDVMERLGPMSKSAAAQRVSRARAAGLLAPTTRGRPSTLPGSPVNGPASSTSKGGRTGGGRA